MAFATSFNFNTYGLKRFPKQCRFESELRNILAGFFFFSMMLRLTGYRINCN